MLDSVFERTPMFSMIEAIVFFHKFEICSLLIFNGKKLPKVKCVHLNIFVLSGTDLCPRSFTFLRMDADSSPQGSIFYIFITICWAGRHFKSCHRVEI